MLVKSEGIYFFLARFVHINALFYMNINIHCVQKKTPTHIFVYISMSDMWI